MSLRDDIKIKEDYYALSLAIWNKLETEFGGAPEIPIFQYHSILEDGSKQNHHDFNPIKIKVRIVESLSDATSRHLQTRTCLISKYLGATQVIAYLGGIFQDCSVKSTLFIIKPSNSDKEFIKVAGTTKLIDAGLITSGMEICLF